MHAIRLFLFFLTILFATGGSSMSLAQGVAADAPQLTRLPNGLSVLLLPDSRFPLVSLRLYVHAGSAYETPAQAGLSHFLEHMVFKGTEKRKKGDIAGDIEKIGGYINAATSFDYTVYIADVPSSDWLTGMDVIRDMAFHSTFDPEEIEAEKNVVVSELEQRDDAPQSRLFTLIQERVFQGTTYARPIIGNRESIHSFTRDDFKNYISRYYQPQSMLLLIAGDIQPEKALAEAQRLFGGYVNTRSVQPPTLISPNTLRAARNAPGAAGPFAVEKRPVQKAYLAVALPAAGSGSPDAIPDEVFAYLLGGDATSPLYRKYKYELQLVDDISAGYYDFERTGMIYISAVLPEDRLEEFWKLFAADLATLALWAEGSREKSPFTREELDRAKLLVEDGLFRAKETLAGLASKTGSFYFLSNDLNAEEHYLAAIKQLDLDAVRQAARDILSQGTVYGAAIIPEGAQAPDLAAIFNAAWKDVPKAPRPADGQPQQALSREVIELGFGRTLVLIPDKTMPYVALDLAFKGGNTLQSAGQQGLAALAASALTTGAAGMTSPEIDVFLSSRAAALTAAASSRAFTVSMRYPVRFSADMKRLLLDTLGSPAFSSDEIAREKKNQLAAIAMREDQPLSLAFRHLMPFLFPDQPYGYYQLGMPDTVSAFTREEILAFWEKQSAMPWVMAVCGDFDREDILAFVKDLPVPTQTLPALAPPRWTKERELALTLPGRNQEHLLLVFPTAGGKSPEAAGLDLLETILSGMSGILFTSLRDEQGLGYTVTAFKWQTDLAGFLAFYIGTEPSRAKESLDGFSAVIDRLHAAPLPEAELAKAVRQLEGEYYRTHQSLGSRSAEAATLLALGYPLTYRLDIMEKAKTLTPEDLRALAVKYLILKDAYTVRVQP